MKIKLHLAAIIFFLPALLLSQPEPGLNRTDEAGNKQGRWIKKYPNNMLMYDGFFTDNIPEGEFKRYDERGMLRAVLTYSNKGMETEAAIYHSNGYLSAKGRYLNRKKEGMWQFYSEFISGYKVSEENYSGNLRNGCSVKLYPDGTIAEKFTYTNDTARGEWIKYYPDGEVCLRSTLINGRINGKFEAWFENGKLQFSGKYINDKREGTWHIYDKDGTLRYRMEYKGGVTNDRNMDIELSDYLDSLEKNKGKIPDPEKNGVIW